MVTSSLQRPPAAGTFAGWRGVVAFSCVLALGIVTAIHVGARTPVLPLLGLGVLLVAAVVLLRARPGRDGAILALLAGGVLLAPAAIAFPESLAWAHDPVEFTIAMTAVVACGLLAVGGIAVLVGGRSTVTAGSSAPRGLVIMSFFLIVLAFIASLALRLAFRDAEAAANDVVVSITNFAYADTITAPAGKLAIVVRNNDRGAHTLTVDALDIDVVVPGNAGVRATATADPGTYAVRCRIPGHDFMRGTLVVR
jgi:plastocyanin